MKRTSQSRHRLPTQFKIEVLSVLPSAWNTPFVQFHIIKEENPEKKLID